MTTTLDPVTTPGARLGADFARLWAAYSASELGSAIGLGALPLIAVLALHASTLEVALLATLSGLVSAAVALPLGDRMEFRAKRPVMICTDLVRFAALGSVPIAAALGVLTFAQLCVVAIIQTVCAIAFRAASGAHLKALVSEPLRIRANARLESTFWTVNTAGPAIGGVLITLTGATATIAADSVSFLLSAIGIRRIRTPEPAPPLRTAPRHWWRDTSAGWRAIKARTGLQILFWNSLVFGGCVMLASPLLAVLMLRDLGFAPWQYGLALGVPCAGGLLGSLAVPALVRRFGDKHVMQISGLTRGLPLAALPLASHGTTGLVVIVGSQFAMMLCTGVFNPLFATYRLNETADAEVTRVLASWSISQRVAQPLFIAAGGVIATLTNTQVALTVAAIVAAAGGLLLPWSD